MKRNRLALAAAGGALALGASLATGTGTANATPVSAQAAWYNCDPGEICVYSGSNGTGAGCWWTGDDPDWLAGSIQCSWADTAKVVSIWNRGTGSAGSYRHVKFYHQANYTNYYACAAQGFKDNTGPDGGVWLRSHKWVTTC